MTHVRTQLRTALGAVLAGLPAVPYVYINRARALDHTQAPCLRITTPQERAEPLGVSVGMQDRTVTVLIEAFVKAEPLDDAADQAGLEVEQAIEAAGTLGGLIKAPMQLDEVRLEIEDTASPPLAVLRMAYTAQIYTLAAAPDIAI